MKKIKLFKTLLIPSLGVLTLGTIAAVATSCSCALQPTPVIHVESVSLDEHNLSLAVGDNRYLNATISPADATDKSVTWTSSNETVAKVDEYGHVTAVKEGTATIAVTTNDGGKTDTCQVTVEQLIHVESVTLNESSVALDVGKTKTLIATVLPENATDKSVTWTSSNETVAKVDEYGHVTAVKEGTATIAVTTNDGGKTDTCEVTVTLPYVCLEANADSTLGLVNNGENHPNLQYSIDGGTSWNTYSEKISISQGQTLYLKGNNPNGWSKSIQDYSTFNIAGDVSWSGNVMGLLDNGAKPGEQGDITAIPCDFCFYELFRNSTGITSISKNFLPATTLAAYCYSGMFQGCRKLATVPIDLLPADTLAKNCYNSMFEGCTNLRNAPEFPATKLADWCYYGMFHRCTSLTQAPELPATTLALGCYSFMFGDCDSLTTAPDLPATNLVWGCYSNMFSSCTSLTQAPELPATTLADSCYFYMFDSCSSLNSIRIGYIGKVTEAPSSAFDNWVDGVANTGTFYYEGSDSVQDFGFPEGWTVNPN